MNKPLPPYGKRLKERMRKGYRPTNGINIYASWENGRVIPDAVTFPPDATPNEFNWTFLAGQEISLINTESLAEYEKLKELAELLIQSGVKSVGLIDLDHSLHWYLPERIAA